MTPSNEDFRDVLLVKFSDDPLGIPAFKRRYAGVLLHLRQRAKLTGEVVKSVKDLESLEAALDRKPLPRVIILADAEIWTYAQASKAVEQWRRSDGTSRNTKYARLALLSLLKETPDVEEHELSQVAKDVLHSFDIQDGKIDRYGAIHDKLVAYVRYDGGIVVCGFEFSNMDYLTHSGQLDGFFEHWWLPWVPIRKEQDSCRFVENKETSFPRQLVKHPGVICKPAWCLEKVPWNHRVMGNELESNLAKGLEKTPEAELDNTPENEMGLTPKKEWETPPKQIPPSFWYQWHGWSFGMEVG